MAASGRAKKNDDRPEVNIDELAGIALGCIGMSRMDFEGSTPEEFRAVFDQWTRMMEQRERGDWERVRMLCASILQPYSSKALKPQDVMTFPWEKEVAPDERPGQKETRHESRAEILRRYEAAKRLHGLSAAQRTDGRDEHDDDKEKAGD